VFTVGDDSLLLARDLASGRPVFTVGDDSLLLARDLASGRPVGARHMLKERPKKKVDPLDLIEDPAQRKKAKDKAALLSGGGKEGADGEGGGDGKDRKDLEGKVEKDVVVDDGKKVVIWNFKLTCIDISGDGLYVAIGQSDGGFSVLETKSEDGESVSFENLYALQPIRPCTAITQIRLSRDGRQVAVGLSSGLVRVYEVTGLGKPKPRPTSECKGLTGQVVQIDWDDKGRVIRVNDDNMDLRLFDTGSGQELGSVLAKFEGGGKNGKELSAIYLEGRWASTTCPRSWPTHGLFLEDFDAADVLVSGRSKSGKLLAFGDRLGQVSVVAFPCLRPRAPRSTHSGHAGSVAFLGFAPNDSALVTAADSGRPLAPAEQASNPRADKIETRSAQNNAPPSVLGAPKAP
ncbi:WD40-repeat-containing domain protein, partial [Baffinella frigidus]